MAIITGTAGDDTLSGGLGPDQLRGGTGNDKYIIDEASDVVFEAAGEGNDAVYASVSYTLAAAAYVEILATINAAATTAINLAGNGFANSITGNAGANTLIGGAGADTLSGLGGNDAYYVDNAADVVVEAAGGGIDRVFASVSYTLGAAAQVETLSTTDNTGTAAINLAGNGFANSITGNAGANSLIGGAGADTLSGLGGNDRYYVDNVGDVIVEAAGGGIDRVFASVSYSLGVAAQVETLSTTDNAGTAAINLAGNGFANSLIGNAGANTLIGGAGADTLSGLGGNDRYYVDNVGDVVVEAAGGGVDRVFASVSYSLGATAQVEIFSTTDNAGTAAINLAGNGFANSITGNAGANTLIGGAGADTLSGLGGNDRYYIDNVGDVVVEAAGGGSDRVFASVSYTLGAAAQVETLSTTDNAGTAAINLAGNGFANSLIGNAGANTLTGGAGADTLSGLGGNDGYYVDNVGDVVVEAAGGGNDRVFASVSYTLGAAAQVETLSTTDSAGTAAINLAGNGFANSLIGNAGANTLIGGAGADTLSGLGGDDRYYVDNVGDVVIEAAGGGSDRVFASVSYTLGGAAQVETLSTTDNAGTAAINLAGNGFANSLIGNAGANTLIGGAGADTLSGLGGNDGYYVDNVGDVVVEAAGGGVDRVFASVSYSLGATAQVETLSTTDSAGTAAINLAGNGFANSLIGNAGTNTLIGGAGADTLSGLGGNDGYYVDNVGDVVVEAAGGGSDRVFASVSYVLGAAAQVEILSTTESDGTGAINLTGNGFAQTIYGNAGANSLDGGGGNDNLVGLAGNDVLNGSAGNDTTDGGTGNDTHYVDSAGDVVLEAAGGGMDLVYTSVSYALAASAEVETLSTSALAATTAINLTGNAFNQTLTGNAGVNALNGGGGDDVLNGLGGSDTLTGGAGADRFTFTAAFGAGNIDTITDFEVGVDKIVLGGALGEAFATLATGELGPSHFLSSSSVRSPGVPVIVHDFSTGALLYDADGSGAGAAVQFATVGAYLGNFGASNFLISGPPNTGPTITSGATATVAENTPASTIVYQASAVDIDGDRTIWWTDNSEVSIDEFGAVRLNASPNFELQSSYSFNLYARDSSAAGMSKVVTLTITDVNEPTSFIAEITASNDEFYQAQVIDRGSFVIATNANLPNDDLPSVTITGSISSPTDKDFYSVFLQAGEAIYLDVDNSSGNLDAFLEVYRGGSVWLSNDDQVVPDPGSEPHPDYGHNTDSFIRLRAGESGTYVFAISAFQDPEKPTSGTYELNVSVGPPATPAELMKEDVEALLSGATWDHNNLTYGFPTSTAQYPADLEETNDPGEFAPLTAAQQAVVVRHLGAIASVSGLTFQVAGSPGDANLRYAMSDEADPAYAYYPTNVADSPGGTAWFDKTNFNTPLMGNYAWLTFLHETGHALGLKHGHEAPAISSGHDSLEFSVMTYRSYVGQILDENGTFTNETFGYPSTLMMLDIAALQQMYGANFATNAGNSVYTWSPTTGEMRINGVGKGAPGGNRIFMTLWDGGGTDTYDLSNYSTSVTIDLRPGEWTRASATQIANLGDGRYARGNIANALQFEGDPRSLIENAVAGGSDDTIYGNDIANNLNGGAGNDTLHGYAGNDTLTGGEGYDELHGGDGNDTLSGETLFGDNGNDILNGSDGANTLFGGAGVDVLTGAGSPDSLQGGADADTLWGGASNDVLVGGEGNDALSGGADDDRLNGGDGADTLNGDAGNDFLSGDSGADVMTGGLGDDIYMLDHAGDQVNELAGQGYDTVQTSISYVASAGIEQIVLLGAGAVNATGNGADNVLLGNSAANVLTGGAGNDIMYGYGGNDTYYVDDFDDLVYDLSDGGNDIVYVSSSYVLPESVPPPPGYDPYAGASLQFWPGGPNQIETVAIMGTLDLWVAGNSSVNTLLGSDGVNLLDGKGGSDTLRGYGGDDNFTFSTALGPGNIDMIVDFVVEDDTISLDDAVFTGLGLGTLATGAFALGAAATQADDRIIYNSATGALLFDIDGVGGAAGVQFATLTSALPLAANDFVVV